MGAGCGRRPFKLATAESATAVAATTGTTAAAIKTMAANAPTDPQTLLGIRGIAPSVYPRPGMCCRRDVDSRSGDEWGLRWELAVGGATTRAAGDKKLVGTWPARVTGRSSSSQKGRSHRTNARPPTRKPPPTAESGSCQQEGDAPTIKASLHHMLVIEECDVPWRLPKTPPTPLPPPQPLPSRQWQPTHQLVPQHPRASRVSHPPFTRGLDCAADE